MTTILTPPETGSRGSAGGPPAKRARRKGGVGGVAPGNGATKPGATARDATPPSVDAGHLEELLIALQSARHGDFSVRLPTRRAGLVGRIAAEFNALIETNAKMTKELGRVARAVGRDGRLGERVVLPAATGGWAQDVESVNGMIDSLARPTTEVARVIAAVADGDLSQKMALRIGDQPVRGEFLRIGRVVNAMVDQLGSFSSEVSRVAREVGTEGKLGGQAEVKGVSGTWKDLTENVNQLAGNLTNQVRNIAQVTTAVAEGDLSQKITVEAKGEVAALADTINLMVDQLRSFAAEVTRVAQEVGTEGRLGGQATVPGVSGTWKDLTDSVNFMASNLTAQVRDIAQVTTAVAKGDLSQKITVDVRGEVLELKDTINTMVDQLSGFADEVTRVAREVGTEGRLGGQAEVLGVAGTWKDLTDSVNFMAGNLTTQVRNIAQVTTAVARGDLTQKITVEAKGEVAALADTINSMTDTLRLFAEQVTGVAREVGTEGRLGGQAEVPGVAGTWKDLTDSVNFMASNLTAQVRDIAQVTTAVAKGDLSQKITVDVRGEVLELKDTINTMVDQLSAFADEVTRVAREVGTEGELGGQAEVPGVSGTWKDLTDSVNVMAGNLTTQVRGIVKVVTAVAEGDLSQKFVLEAKGEVAALADTINSMTDTLRSFASEVTRVAREVGTEGELGGQADVPGVAGTWKDLTDSVNSMASNLTGQVRNIAQVTTAVANGDLSQKIGVEAKGEVAALADTINRMVDQLRSFAAEVTRVAQEVGTEGRLGGQAQVPDVAGTWKDLTDSVNFMASNLTGQVRNIAQVTTAVAKGDLTQKITVDVRGEVLELKNTINTMVDQLGSFADEVTRVAKEVGTEGRLGGQAEVPGVSGTWKNLTDSVNSMAGNLTGQVRNIAQVTTAVANGDLTQKITVDVKGEVLELKNTINTMVDQLSAFADEVTRVAREVGTEGRLGGQAQVQGVSGTWRDLTENVNQLAGNLTDQVRNIAQVTTAVAQGDLSQKITVDARGEVAALRDTINNMVDQLRSFAAEVTRVAREVGTDGRLGGQAQVEGVSGTWKDLTENVNQLAGNLTDQVRNIAQVTTAVARGDLTQKITVEAKGEVAALKNTINTMVDQLSAFADEVTRVAREVGTEGRLGGQAQVQGVSGTWRDLTENVNFMAGNLTDQVRNIAQVTTAVARGELNKKITVDARGEILELKNTINTMVDQLSSFAAEVTRVGKEVGTEGKLGGQAEVEGVSGTWKGLTDNVNQLASTLTTQLRAIAEVSTAVTQGDLSRQIAVEAQGEVAELKDNINQMIANLRETTQKNAEQDWLKTNLARISGLMQGQRDLRTVSRLIMSELTPVVSAQLGAFFLASPEEVPGGPVFNLLAAYGYRRRDGLAMSFASGEGLVGQAAVERKSILITEAPADYIRIGSGLGEAAPVNIIVIPVLFEDEVRAVIELASFQPFSEVHLTFLDQLRETIGVVLNTIIANMRTEELLEQSQSYARLLEEQNRDIEVKNREIELAQVALQERAEQLALSSKYKSEFLANMSHELRTPLNSLLILAKLLAEDPNNTLTPKQVEYAQTIHAAGSDLLSLISDILDLSKVEAGKMDLLPAQTLISKVVLGIDQEFRPIADQKGLTFECEVQAGTPESVVTDEQRLWQVLRNLLSNALKFTERGVVRLRVGPAPAGMSFSEPTLRNSPGVLAFAVSDTGIGVPDDKLRLIFEAFQQADGTTSRRYGGTGLGLNISREIAHLLGGEIRVESKVGAGSVFTLYVPAQHADSALAAPLALSGPASSPDDLDPRAGTAASSPSLPVVLLVGVEPGVVQLGSAAVEVEQVGSAAEAVAALERGPVDCVVVDLSTTSADGLALLERVQKDPSYQELPFVVYAQRTLNKREETRLSRYAEAIQVHRASDEADLAREVGAALHLRVGRRQAVEAEFDLTETPELAGRRVLIIDDDVRNVFALTSALEASGMEVLFAENGRDGLQVLEAHPEVELVLLDIMMPEMDGYETAAAIRVQPQFASLPIIVLTAKAMIGDRERAVEAGASDYVTKPVDLPHLLSVMHGWLNR